MFENRPWKTDNRLMNEGVRCEGWGEKLFSSPVPATRMGESQRQSGALFPFLTHNLPEHQGMHLCVTCKMAAMA
ncbi:hypothetical protein CEXT_429761 [Caerostris extrusa]|uniref:Uncharacterized protein n=1 Tax=Caerostris extrusa TaxID=172846 RepID=A0AAV4Q0R4_CAEEX|nr:hypothetical protein CEXT_429761 [Caerostris extrusa]